MRSRTRSLAFLTFSLASACTTTGSPGKWSADPETDFSPPRTNIADTPRPVEPPSATEARAFANASNAFGDDLYARLATEPGNITMSPASISMALAMTWTGAHGQTRDEMTRVLHLNGDPKVLTA